MIHLVNMPFGSVLHPSIALGQIKAQLRDAGLSSRVFYFNLAFASQVGVREYETVAQLRGFNSQIGEWLFARYAWRKDLGLSDDEFLDDCGVQGIDSRARRDFMERLVGLRDRVVPDFLDRCCRRIAGDNLPRVVGFSCTFFQTIASLALARLLKERHPAVQVVFGGACFHGEMGQELIAKVPWIDCVSTGEADDIAVPLFQALLNDQDPAGLQGVLFRRTSQHVVAGPESHPITQQVLEGLPDPDYDDYFAEMEASGFSRLSRRQVRTFLPYESSRGCWWGQKQHCTFCGLNNEGMAFRMKSAGRVLQTLHNFAAKYGVQRFHATDNILPTSYFRDLLPMLRDDPLADEWELFYEIKANVSREWVRLLAAAGVRFVQPGIESLSTHLLQCIRKGTKAIQNIYLLKLCRQYGVTPLWNLLIRIPGESWQDYETMQRLIPRLTHLCAPVGGARKVEMHRFSPYFFEAGKWADNVRPRKWYAALFPSSDIDLSRIAYYFDADWKGTLPDAIHDQFAQLASNWVAIWRDSTHVPRLQLQPTPSNQLAILDTRCGRQRLWQLTSDEACIYQAIEDPSSVARIKERAADVAATCDVVAVLDQFVEYGLAVEESGQYLGLALPSASPDPPLSFRNRFYRRLDSHVEAAVN